MDTKKALEEAKNVKSSATSLVDCLQYTEYIPEVVESLEKALKGLKEALKK